MDESRLAMLVGRATAENEELAQKLVRFLRSLHFQRRWVRHYRAGGQNWIVVRSEEAEEFWHGLFSPAGEFFYVYAGNDPQAPDGVLRGSSAVFGHPLWSVRLPLGFLPVAFGSMRDDLVPGALWLRRVFDDLMPATPDEAAVLDTFRASLEKYGMHGEPANGLPFDDALARLIARSAR